MLTNLINDIFPLVLTWLPIDELVRSSLVSKKFKLNYQHNFIWEERFALHFPHLYLDESRRFKSTNTHFWYDAFKHACAIEYQYLLPKQKKLFLLGKDGNLSSFQKLNPTVSDTAICDSRKVTLCKWLAITQNQHILVWLYQQYAAESNSDAHLKWAVLFGLIPKSEQIEYLLNQEHINFPNKSGYKSDRSTHLAAALNYVDVLDILLKQQVPVNLTGSFYETALHKAATIGNVEATQLLLKNGADVNARNNFGATSLLLATYYQRLNVVKLLLAANADATIPLTEKNVRLKRAEEGDTAYHIAAKFDLYEILSALLLKQSLPDITSRAKLTPLHYAVISGHLKTVKLLRRKGANINAQTTAGASSIILATLWKKEDVVAYLLKHSANLQCKMITSNPYYKPFWGGDNVLHGAIKTRQTLIAKMLLENHADANAIGNSNFTPLHYASLFGSLDILLLLLNHGALASINNQSIAGASALFLAVIKQQLQIVNVLLSHQADHTLSLTTSVDFHAPLIKGSTPLHAAAINSGTNSHAIIKALINHGANALAKDDKGRTPKKVAVKENKPLLALAEYAQTLTLPTQKKLRGKANLPVIKNLEKIQITKNLMNLFFKNNKGAINVKTEYELKHHKHGKLSKLYHRLSS